MSDSAPSAGPDPVPDPVPDPQPVPVSVYEVLGASWFIDLVDRFYDAVETDSVLRPLYPDDLTSSRMLLAGFLIQYWGGPTDYSDRQGHPRLRMRHAPFPIGQAERDAWFLHMSEAVAAAEPPSPILTAMVDYFDHAATAMMNQ